MPKHLPQTFPVNGQCTAQSVNDSPSRSSGFIRPCIAVLPLPVRYCASTHHIDARHCTSVSVIVARRSQSGGGACDIQLLFFPSFTVVLDGGDRSTTLPKGSGACDIQPCDSTSRADAHGAWSEIRRQSSSRQRQPSSGSP